MPWAEQDDGLLAFTHRLVQLRAEHPVFRRQDFLAARAFAVSFFAADGAPLSSDDLPQDGTSCISMFLDGTVPAGIAADGTPITDAASILMVLNPYWGTVDVTLPDVVDARWHVELATEAGDGAGDADGGAVPLARPGRSLLVLSTPVP
jgi:glycogen operon protein